MEGQLFSDGTDQCVVGVRLVGLTSHIPFVLALPDLYTSGGTQPAIPGGKVKGRFSIGTKIYWTIEEVVCDKGVELAVVGIPNDTHYALAKAALEAGKHVLVDKPVTETVAQARELDAIAKSKRRWDSDHTALKRLLLLPPFSPQSFGSLLEFESHYDRLRVSTRTSWKDGVGAYDLGSHLLDEALKLFGGPAKITAFVQSVCGVTKPEVDDIAQACFLS